MARGVRVGAVKNTAVAVDHAWLSHLQAGYQLEGSPGHSALLIVREEPSPALLSAGATAHRPVVGVVMPRAIEGSDTVVEAIVRELGA